MSLHHIDLSGIANKIGSPALSKGAEDAIVKSDRVVLFVHGYNVQSDESFMSHSRFVELATRDKIKISETWLLCKWPGAAMLPDIIPSGMRYAYYGQALQQARQIATRFFSEVIQWIFDIAKRKQIVIIAHSLGCRLILQALQKDNIRMPIGQITQPIVVFLLAAAIPVHLLDPNERDDLSQVDDHFDIIVFFSSLDRALGRATFGLIQTLCGEGNFPEAVGLHGGPERAPWTNRIWMIRFDHNTYLSHPKTIEYIRRILGDRWDPMGMNRTLPMSSLPMQELFRS